ncbi:phage tail protein [Pseudomonas sp. 13B_3.2_Bac1]|uniref:gp53-like domain-containing protein n=1 Tax=Pseudomonas sp. 13B_3.2_Bac1 TaxID=2971623 RepID=UPI0021C93669|nr:phage tail protein [Pseudomonas sp. 13B_3.2_Bac1]MCU1773343.1 phage tail protein [Pseudomonas sp. 13B_3.2_Bac1]
MDFPKNVPSAGLVNGQFVDEDLLVGKPGSLIPASWGNGVTQEILGVVRAAGMTPSETSNTQLLGALRSTQLFQTPAQFDVSRSVATPEFVQRALGNYAGSRSVNAATQLTIADVGWAIGFGGDLAYTVNLPDINSVPNGATFTLHCRSNAAVTVACTGSAKISPQGAYLTSIVMNSGESATVVREYGIWAVQGTASLKYAALFSGACGNPGYQKHASGNIDQWGTVVTDVNGEALATFPISFPNAFSSCVATHVGTGGAMVIVMNGSGQKQSVRLKMRDALNGVSANWVINYFARGY